MAVEFAVHGAVCGAFAIFMVDFSELGVFPWRSDLDRLAGVECISGCRYFGSVGLHPYFP